MASKSTNHLQPPADRAARRSAGAPAPTKTYSAKNDYEVLRQAQESGRLFAIELRGEDDQFKGRQREQLLALIRNSYRSSPLPRSLVLQRRLNVVGSIGGKLQITTKSPEWNRAAERYFRHWSRNCEFTDAKHLNELLQLIISALDTGGDCVVVHDAWTPDGGVLCGSNKVRVFESDEIGNLPSDYFATHFPGHTQIAGKIYDAFGRHVGITVSTSERGQAIFNPEKAITLTRDPDAPETAPWVYLQDAWRVNQGRGVSTFAASVDLLSGFGDILSSEVSAAKLNASLFGAYTRSAQADEDHDALDQYTIDTVEDEPADGPISVNGSVGAELDETEEFPDQIARARKIFFDVLPDGYKMDIADTKRPNDKVEGFLRLIAGHVAASLGLNETYATLEPQSSYTAFRGAQVLARPSFIAAQKFLERNLCDWLAARILSDAVAFGILPEAPEDWADCFTWSWPHQEEVDAVNEQNALALKLKNGTVTLAELFGPDWRDRVAEIAEEAQAMAAAGLIHPATQTASGQLTSGTTPQQQGE